MKYAKAHGLLLGEETNCGIPGVFIDGGQSAKKKSALADRPGGFELLMSVQKGDHLVFTSPHRAFRNLLESERQLKIWEADGNTIHFTDHNLRTDTPNGRLILQLMFVVAEWKSRINQARVREGIAFSKAKRGEVGACPDKELEVEGMKIPTQTIESSDTLTQVWLDIWERRHNPLPMKVTGKVHGYIRVSKASQNIDMQRKAIRDWHAASEFSHLTLRLYVDQGQSAYSKDISKRTEGKELMRRVQEGDVVVSVRADRMCRSMRNMLEVLEYFDKKKVTCVMLDCNLRTDTRFGKMLLGMLSFVAELESHESDISINSAVAHSVQAKGLPVSRIPIWMRRPMYHNKTTLSYMMTDDEWAAMAWKAHRLFEEGYGSRVVGNICNQRVSLDNNWPLWDFRHGVTGGTMIDAIEEDTPKPYTEFTERMLKFLKSHPRDHVFLGFIPPTLAGKYNRRFKKYWEKILAREDIVISEFVTILPQLLKLHEASRTRRGEKPADI